MEEETYADLVAVILECDEFVQEFVPDTVQSFGEQQLEEAEQKNARTIRS